MSCMLYPGRLEKALAWYAWDENLTDEDVPSDIYFPGVLTG